MKQALRVIVMVLFLIVPGFSIGLAFGQQQQVPQWYYDGSGWHQKGPIESETPQTRKVALYHDLCKLGTDRVKLLLSTTDVMAATGNGLIINSGEVTISDGSFVAIDGPANVLADFYLRVYPTAGAER